MPVELGPEGVKRILPFGKISEYETGLLKAATGELGGNISKVSRVCSAAVACAYSLATGARATIGALC